ncbi:FHA domain-containing protein [Mariniluteicoccus flavus]
MSDRTGLWRATYTPGEWIVLGGPTSLVIMSPAKASASQIINSLWDTVVESDSLDAVVATLATMGVDRMPNFAALFWANGEMRSLVRGSVKVVDLATGDVVADGDGVQTWSERGFGDVRRVRVDMEDVDQESVLQLPLVVGAVSASAIVVDATDEAVVSSPQKPVAAPAVKGSGAAGSKDAGDQDARESGEPSAEEVEARVNSIHGGRTADASPEQGRPEQGRPAEEPAIREVPGFGGAAAGAAGVAAGLAGATALGAERPNVPQAPPPLGAQPGQSGPSSFKGPGHPGQGQQGPGQQGPGQPGFGGPGPYGGQPQAQPPQGGPSQGQPYPPGFAQSSPQNPAYAPGFAGQTGPFAPRQPQGPGQQPGPGHQFGGQPQPGQQQPPQPGPQQGQYAGQQHAAWGPQGGQAGGPGSQGQQSASAPASASGVDDGESLVLAVMCTMGHPNPPEAQRCRRCGNPVQGSPQLVTRPVMATLRPSVGQPVDVDRGVLIGRSPTATRVAREQLPKLLTVPSPSHDISRTHLQISPEGWDLMATDLHSTNGTALLRPGAAEPERLTPGEPVPVFPGCVLDLGDGVTVRVDHPA